MDTNILTSNSILNKAGLLSSDKNMSPILLDYAKITEESSCSRDQCCLYSFPAGILMVSVWQYCTGRCFLYLSIIACAFNIALWPFSMLYCMCNNKKITQRIIAENFGNYAFTDKAIVNATIDDTTSDQIKVQTINVDDIISVVKIDKQKGSCCCINTTQMEGYNIFASSSTCSTIAASKNNSNKVVVPFDGAIGTATTAYFHTEMKSLFSIYNVVDNAKFLDEITCRLEKLPNTQVEMLKDGSLEITKPVYYRYIMKPFKVGLITHDNGLIVTSYTPANTDNGIERMNNIDDTPISDHKVPKDISLNSPPTKGDRLVGFNGLDTSLMNSSEVIKLLQDAEIDKLHLFKFKRAGFVEVNAQSKSELPSKEQNDNLTRETKTVIASQPWESSNAIFTPKVDFVSAPSVASVQQPVYKQIVAKEDYEKIHAHLIEAKNAVDHALVLQHLSNISCESAADLEFIEDADYDKFLELMKPGIPTKKLMKLLNR